MNSGNERDKGDLLDLPKDLGKGLTLRWGRSQDSTASVEFNGRVFGEDGGFDEGVAFATHDWMSGKHPTVKPEDFTLVVDEEQGGKIVSSMTLISQVWAYAGIEFRVGRLEAIATDPEYRRRGLVRQQFKVMHERSAQRGQLMQVIGGIPWYYHQFGYELALAMQGKRDLFWTNISQLELGQTETYHLRPATADDIELLSNLYTIHCASSLITQIRGEAEWRFAITNTHPKSIDLHHYSVIEDDAGVAVGYVGLYYQPDIIAVSEMAVLPGYPMRLVCEFLTRALKTLSDERNLATPSGLASFTLGTSHPVYTALGEQLSAQKPPSAWYVRIPDLPAFLRHIAPALEKRLEASVFDGYSGTLRLNFYHSGLTLVLEHGKLIEAKKYTSGIIEESEAAFPGPTFLQLILGYRSLSDLEYADPDCIVSNSRTRVLLDVLFPKCASSVAASA